MERVKKLLKSDKPLTWVFYGDSITHGSTHTFGWRDYTELFAERIRGELSRPMDMVIDSAISGNKTYDLLESFDWRVGRFSPDVVFVMIGMNDCSENSPINLDEFTNNLRKLADMIESLGAIAVMQTTCLIIPHHAPDREPFFFDYMEAIRKVSSEKQLPLIDHTAYWQENSEKLFYWMSNAFHPNEMGHRVFAKLIFKSLGIWDSEKSNVCKLFIP